MEYTETGGGDAFGMRGPLSSRKSRLVALLFAIFFGMIGFHRFYVGKIGTGLLQLVLTLTGVGFFVSAVWVFVDFILILCGEFKDDHGRKITRWDN